MNDSLPTADAEELFAQVVDEFTDRLHRGEVPRVDDYAARYPHLAADLRAVLGMLPALRPEPADGNVSTLPNAAAGTVVQGEFGPQLAGFTLHGELGRGGMGVVYHATQVMLGRPVALKMVLSGAHATAEERVRFLNEAGVLANFQHPHIVPVYEFGSDPDGRPYFALEYLAGGSLAGQLQAGPLPPAAAAGVVRALAAAVGYAHARGVIHRDLKPANVLFAADGTPKVTDFGLAKRTDAGDGFTATHAVLGTPSYMAPEQASGVTAAVGPPADVYALGAILYECLTGRPPFRGVSVFDTLAQVRTREPIAVRELQPSVPKDLETVCLKCLQKDPAKRYPSADALADDLERFLDGRAIQARPVSAVEKAWRWCKRNRLVASLGGLAAGLLMAVAAGSAMAALWYRATLETVSKAEGAARREKGVADEQREKAEENQGYARRLWSDDRSRAGKIGRPGQREDVLKNLGEAAGMARRLDATAEEVQVLRDQAVSALTRWDIRMVRDVEVIPENGRVAVDADHTRYAVTDPAAEVVRVCSLTDDTPCGELLLPDHRVTNLEFTPDGKAVVLGLRTAAGTGTGGTYLIGYWVVGEGKLGWQRPVGIAPRWAVSANGNTLAAESKAGPRKVIEFLDPATGKPRASLPLDKPVIGMKYSPDGRKLAVLCNDLRSPVFDVASQKELFPIEVGNAQNDVCWSADGDEVILGSLNGRVVTCYSGKTGAFVRRVGPQGGGNTQVAVARTAPLLLTRNNDGTGRLYDADTLAELVRVPSALRALSADGRSVVGQSGQRLQVWEVSPPPAVRRVLVGGKKAVLRPNGFTPDGRLLAVGTAVDSTTHLIDPRTGESLAKLPGRFLAQPTGREWVTSDTFGSFRWPVEESGGEFTLGPPRRTPGPPFEQMWVEWDGKQAGTRRKPAGRGSIGEVIDLTQPGWPAVRIPMPSESSIRVAPSPDGRWLVSTANGTPTQVWAAATLTRIDAEFEKGTITAAFTPDGRKLVLGGYGDFVEYEVGTWKEIGRVAREPGAEVQGTVQFSPDGNTAAYIYGPGTVLLADPAGRPLARLSDMGTDEVRYPVFSPDGTTLAVLTANELYIWDLTVLRRRLREVGLDWSDAPIPERAATPPPVVRLVGLSRITPATQVSKAELANAVFTLTANPFDPDANLLLGQFTTNVVRDNSAAADRFRLATLALPDSPVAHHDRIEAGWKVARWKEVVEACDEYVRSGGTPDDDWGPLLRYYRGTALQQLGKHEDALKEFDKLADGKTPVRCAAREARAISYLALKKSQKLVDDDLREALAQSDGNAARRAEYLLLFPPGGTLDPKLAAHAQEVATRGVYQTERRGMSFPLYALARLRSGLRGDPEKGLPPASATQVGPAGVLATWYVKAMRERAEGNPEADTTLATAERRYQVVQDITPNERFLLDRFRTLTQAAFAAPPTKSPTDR